MSTSSPPAPLLADPPGSATARPDGPAPGHAPPVAVARRRRMPRWVWIAGGGVVVVGLIFGTGPLGFWDLLRRPVDAGLVHRVVPGPLQVTLKEDGEIRPVHSVELKCEVQGQGLTIEWIVEESTHVKAGDPLFRIAADELRNRVDQEQIELTRIEAALADAQQNVEITKSENASKLKKAQVEFEVAMLELQRYTEGEFQKASLAATIAIKQTEMELARTKDELNKSRWLHERRYIATSKIEELEDDVERLTLLLEKNKQELAILEQFECAKNTIEKSEALEQARLEVEREMARGALRLGQAEAKLAEAQATLEVRKIRFERLKDQLSKTEVVAPIDGVVRYGGDEGGGFRWGGNRIATGEQVYAGQTLITIPDTSQMMVRTRIHEADRHKVEEGLRCIVKVPACPGQTFSGTISKIAKFADSERGWLNPNLKEHAAEILLDQADAALSPGDTAQVEILIEEVPNVLAVPVQCVFSRGAKHFVFVQRGLSAEPVEVKLGRATTAMIEVSEGLTAGDAVLMTADERLQALLPTPVASQPAPPPPPDRPRPAGGADSGRRVSRGSERPM